MDLPPLIEACATHINPITMSALISVESNGNPFAIGVVGGALERQPSTKEEAIETAKKLLSNDRNFSIGLGQVNLHNLEKYDLTIESVFTPCLNLQASAAILQECYGRAKNQFSPSNKAVEAALSCYYSGNFKTGFKIEKGQSLSYVNKVKAKISGSARVEGSYQVPLLNKSKVAGQLSGKQRISVARASSTMRIQLRTKGGQK